MGTQLICSECGHLKQVVINSETVHFDSGCWWAMTRIHMCVTSWYKSFHLAYTPMKGCVIPEAYYLSRTLSPVFWTWRFCILCLKFLGEFVPLHFISSAIVL